MDQDSGTHSLLVRWRVTTDAAGYVIHWGSVSGMYTDARDVGASAPSADGVVEVRLEGVDAMGTIYFAVVSYDESGTSSRFSNELAVAVP